MATCWCHLAELTVAVMIEEECVCRRVAPLATSKLLQQKLIEKDGVG